MNDKESPFSNPNDVNPFAVQPSYTTQQHINVGVTGEYNPFENHRDQASPLQHQHDVQPATIEAVRADPAPVYQAKTFPSRPGGYGTGDDSMRQRQEELERKAAELEQREQELKRLQQNVPKEKNFPPFPKCCKVNPCYYHDISMEIPVEWQKTCRLMFLTWQAYVFNLCFNFICGLAGVAVKLGDGATLFGVSIIYLVLFPPCSFVFWYRPLYKALKSNSSFNFMLFFFVFFCQTILTFIYGLGISSLGTCGWINGASLVDSSQRTVAAMFFICGALFTLLGLVMVYLLRKIHGAYRNSGASFEKAQKEFITDVASNKNVQNAAATAVTTGIQSQTKY